jgi:hypothetical protein
VVRTKRQILRVFLLRWHRRFGVVLSICLFWLAATGIALNHSVDMNMDHTSVGWNWLRSWYSGGQTEVKSFETDTHWISQTESGYLYINGVENTSCDSPLVGGINYQDLLIAACANSLVLLNQNGELLEHVDSLYGLPTPLTGIAIVEGVLLIEQNENIWQVDIDSMTFVEKNNLASVIEWSQSNRLPVEYSEPMHDEIMGPGVSWERLVLDLHSGQFFGFKGRLLTDFFAFGLILLAFSGVWVWSSKPGRWKK